MAIAQADPNEAADETGDSATARRLRRLGLLEDNGRIPALDSVLKGDLRTEPLERPAARIVLRAWAEQSREESIQTAVQLVALEHMRNSPIEAASLLKERWRRDLPSCLVGCALQVARDFYSIGRDAFAGGEIDRAVNYLIEGQREFLFALSSGALTGSQDTEARGKYAVAVAFTSRWLRTSPHVLRRALRYHRESITAGNKAPEAWVYLIELLEELFNQAEDRQHLAEARRLALERGLDLMRAQIDLKIRLLEADDGRTPSYDDLVTIVQAARSYRPTSGVEFFQASMVEQLAMAAIRGVRPLVAPQVRLPYGFLLELPRLRSGRLAELLESFVAPLAAMRDRLKNEGRPPNAVAQQVLAALLTEAASRPETRRPERTELLVEVASEAASQMQHDRHIQWRYAEALLTRAKVTGEVGALRAAVTSAEALCRRHPTWPLPRVTLARALQAGNSRPDSCHQNSPALTEWARATELVISSPEYGRSDLGGRSGVFAVDDARGDLATALVFKPLARLANGERERGNMALLQRAVKEGGEADRFGVPQSLALVTVPDGRHVHVMERQVGRVLASLPKEEAVEYLGDCARLLGLYHRVAERPPPGSTGWKTLRKSLNLWTRRLITETNAGAEFIEQLKGALPPDLPVLPKRDAHPGNWVIDSAERIVAIDLEGGADVPVGYDIAQLVEDGALLPVSEEGFHRRYDLFADYLNVSGIALPVGVLEQCYDWFALYRAIWLATSSGATKAQHGHARQLARHLAARSRVMALRGPASVVAKGVRVVSDQHGDSALTPRQRSLSKAMARILRHRAPELGLEPDESGFVKVGDLSAILNATPVAIAEVAAHPAEPRFQLLRGEIRALYGHSFVVDDLHEINVELPPALFHGTSWKYLGDIAEQGLRPMRRQHVHLTNNPGEAVHVARRHGRPVLLEVKSSEALGLRAVADAVWAAEGVTPEGIRIRNLFTEVPVPPDWLMDASLEG